MAIITGRGARS